MFQQLRGIAKSRISGVIIIGALVLAFGLWGVGDIFRGAISDAVAEVGDTEITGVQLSQELQARMRTMSQQMNTNFTLEQARQFGIDQIVLQELLSAAAINEVASNLGLTASNDMVRETIQAQPAFQNLSGPQIVQTLLSSGYTEQAYVEVVRGDIARTQLLQSIATGVTPPSGLVSLLHDLINESRIINYVVLTPEDAEDVPAPTEEQLTTFHAGRPDLFNAPEYRSIEYVAIGPAQVADQLDVTEEELLAEYENPVTPLGTPETREIQQINFDDQEAALAAKARIDEGEAFLAIAQERGLTEDDISRGTLTEEDLGGAAAVATFVAEVGSVTEPVEGPFGWLLNHVVSITPATEISFEEARDQIRENIISLRAANLIADFANAYSDASAGGATLPEAAAETGIESIAIAAVDNAGLLPDGTSAMLPDDPTFLEQAFVTNEGNETFLFEGLDEIYYAVRISGVTPATLRPLETVRSEVETAWAEDALANALQRRGAEVSDEVRASGLESTAQTLDRIVMVSMPLRRDSFDETLGSELLQQIFSVPQGSVVSGSAANGVDHVVARIENISHPVPDITSDEFLQLSQSMSQQMAQDVVETFASAAREEVGVTTYPDAIDVVLAQGIFY
jgi:peptidyl-prolyl cis-trans isomerase D